MTENTKSTKAIRLLSLFAAALIVAVGLLVVTTGFAEGDTTIARSTSPAAVEAPARTTANLGPNADLSHHRAVSVASATNLGPNADLSHHASTAAISATSTANLGPNADLSHHRAVSVASATNLGPNADLPRQLNTVADDA